MAITKGRVRFCLIIVFFMLFAMFSGDACRAAAPPDTVTQADAQKQSEAVHALGSDQSLRNSATTAMQALIKFGDSDIIGATKSAYKAYGNFKDSENLDRARKQNILAKAAMGSTETNNFTEAEAAFLASSTSYRRLDPSFLTGSDEAKITAEFEKRTGIKGKDFLAMLSSASENKIYVSDPKLAEKIDAEFESFLDKIPNQEFREKVRSASKIVPTMARHQFFVQAVQKMVQLAKDFQGDPNLSAPTVVAGKAAEPKDRTPAAANLTEGAIAEGKAQEEKKDEATPPELNLNGDAMAKANESESGALKLDSVVLAAIESGADNETIFQKVSRRYRSLTPKLR